MKVQFTAEIPNGNFCNYEEKCQFLNEEAEGICQLFSKKTPLDVYLKELVYKKCDKCISLLKNKKEEK